MQAYDTTVQDVFGNAIPGGITQTGASVTVYVGGTSILASIFADQAGAQPLPNPFTSGPNGQITFFAANGNYYVTVSYSGFTITKHIILFDPSGTLINNATPTVPLLSDLQAISTLTAAAAKAVITTGRNSPGDGGGATWIWLSGNQSSLVSSDPNHFTYVPPSSDLSGASGCWKRQGYTGTAKIEWFG